MSFKNGNKEDDTREEVLLGTLRKHDGNYRKRLLKRELQSCHLLLDFSKMLDLASVPELLRSSFRRDDAGDREVKILPHRVLKFSSTP